MSMHINAYTLTGGACTPAFARHLQKVAACCENMCIRLLACIQQADSRLVLWEFTCI